MRWAQTYKINVANDKRKIGIKQLVITNDNSIEIDNEIINIDSFSLLLSFASQEQESIFTVPDDDGSIKFHNLKLDDGSGNNCLLNYETLKIIDNIEYEDDPKLIQCFNEFYVNEDVNEDLLFPSKVFYFENSEQNFSLFCDKLQVRDKLLMVKSNENNVEIDKDSITFTDNNGDNIKSIFCFQHIELSESPTENLILDSSKIDIKSNHEKRMLLKAQENNIIFSKKSSDPEIIFSKKSSNPEISEISLEFKINPRRLDFNFPKSNNYIQIDASGFEFNNNDSKTLNLYCNQLRIGTNLSIENEISPQIILTDTNQELIKKQIDSKSLIFYSNNKQLTLDTESLTLVNKDTSGSILIENKTNSPSIKINEEENTILLNSDIVSINTQSHIQDTEFEFEFNADNIKIKKNLNTTEISNQTINIDDKIKVNSNYILINAGDDKLELSSMGLAHQKQILTNTEFVKDKDYIVYEFNLDKLDKYDSDFGPEIKLFCYFKSESESEKGLSFSILINLGKLFNTETEKVDDMIDLKNYYDTKIHADKLLSYDNSYDFDIFYHRKNNNIKFHVDDNLKILQYKSIKIS